MDLLLGYCWKSYLESHNLPIVTAQPSTPHPQNYDVNGSTSGLKPSWAELSTGVPVGVGVPTSPTTGMVYSGLEHLMPLPPPPSALPYFFPLPVATSNSTHAGGLKEAAFVASAHVPATSSTCTQVRSTNANYRAMNGSNTRVCCEGGMRASSRNSRCKPAPACASVESGFDSGESSPSSSSEDSNSNIYGTFTRLPQTNGHFTIPTTGNQIMLVRSIDTGGRVTLPTRSHHGGVEKPSSGGAFYAFLPVHSLQQTLHCPTPLTEKEAKEKVEDQNEDLEPMPVLEEELPVSDSCVWRCERMPDKETPTPTILFPATELETIPPSDDKPAAKNADTNTSTTQKGSKVGDGGGGEGETRRIQLPCRWSTCRRRFEDNNETYDHVLKDHLEPLRPPNAASKSDTAEDEENASPVRKLSRCRTGTPRREGKARAFVERFKCRWKGCEHALKRSSNPVCQFDWLINHYTTRHASRAQPYKCLLTDCSLRFRLRRSLIDHLSSAHDRRSGAKRDNNTQGVRQEVRAPTSCYSFRPCNRSATDHSTFDAIDQRTMEFIRDELARRQSDDNPLDSSSGVQLRAERSTRRKISNLRPKRSGSKEVEREDSGSYCRVKCMPSPAAAAYIRGIFKPPVLKREA